MNVSTSGGNSILFYWPIINVILLLIILGLSIYFIPIAVKVIKRYIKKNS